MSNIAEYRKLVEQKTKIDAALSAFDPEEIEKFEKVNNYPVPTTKAEINEILILLEDGQLALKDGDSSISRYEWALEEYDLEFDNFTFKYITSEGGYEGAGEDYFFVFAVEVDGEVKSYWRYEGWYSSYGGMELNDFYACKPVDRMVTFYEKV